MRILRGLVLSLLALAPAVIGASAFRSWSESIPYSGLALEDRAGLVVIDRVIAGSPAERAGLRVGDQVESIGGQPVRLTLVANDRLARVAPGRGVGIKFLRDGERRSARVITGAVLRWHQERILGTVVALLFYGAALAVWLRRRQDEMAMIYGLWCLAGVFVLGVSWSSEVRNIDWVLYWFDRWARLFFPALMLHWAALIAGTRRWQRWIPIAYAPAIGLLLAEIHLIGLRGAERSSDPLALVELLRGRLELSWIASGMVAALGLMALLLLRSTSAAQRARFRWVLVGATVGTVPYLLLAAIPRLMGGVELPRSEWTLPLLGLIPISFTGAVLEYRLMDLALFWRRAAVGLATLGLTTLLFLGLISLGRWLLAPWLAPSSLILISLAVALTISLIPAIRAGARDLVGRLYYRRHYNFRRALDHVARDLNAERELPRLIERLEQRVREALDAGTVRLLFVGSRGTLSAGAERIPTSDRLDEALHDRLQRGESVMLADIPEAPLSLPELHAAGIQIVVPLRVEERLIAVLAVGPQRRDSLLDSDDRDLLRSVANHAAAAVAGAVHLAELKEQVTLVQRLRARTEGLIESSPIGMAVIDREGIVKHWNPALESLLGVTRGAALDRPYDQVLPAMVAAHVSPSRGASGSAAQGRAYRVRCSDPEDLEERLVNLTVSPLTGPGGNEGVLLTLDDVTEQAQLEERLIQQDRLASIGMLAAGVAHEVNTPLTGISSYAQMLLEEAAKDDPRRPLLEKIVQQTGRASRIARDLLRLSRPSDPSEAPTLSAVDLKELAEETIGLLSPQALRAGAIVERDWNGETILALGDRGRLQQVVMNLLLNAFDAVGQQGKIRVRLTKAGGRVQLEVQDDGVGIPDELRGKIFDPFFTTKRPGLGTGLGLSICYAIVREHDGRMSVESAPGRGTTMRVELPQSPGAQITPFPRSAIRAS